MEDLPDEILHHRTKLLEERMAADRAAIREVQGELNRRRTADPKVAAFLDEKQARQVVDAGLGPIV